MRPCGRRSQAAGLLAEGGAAVFSIDHWVQGLAALLLLAGIAELLMPSGALRGYARALLGLLVLLGVLQPLVGLLRGDIRLQLPDLLPVAAASATRAQTAAAQAAARSTFEHLVASEAARLAGQVPGVAGAQATLRFAPPGAGEPAVTGASVEVSPNGSPVSLGPGLQARVRAAVAAGLGLKDDQVTVSVW